MQALRGSRILVVGASSGIGRSLGVAAVRAGADVVFAARRADALEAAVRDAGGGRTVVLDVCDPESVEAGVRGACEDLGGLDALVYATGMSPLRRFTDLDASDWNTVMRTNVVGAALVTRAALGRLRGAGIAWYLSSDSTARPRSGLVAYSTSKAALDSMVRGLRAEHPDQRFTTVVVGPTGGTGFADGFDHALMEELFGEWLLEGHLTRTVMDPDDLGTMIAELLASALAHPGVDPREVHLQPPGPTLTPEPGPDA